MFFWRFPGLLFFFLFPLQVIDAHYKTFMAHLDRLSSSSSSSFYQIQRLHLHFLDTLLLDLFLTDIPLLQSITKCLTVCLVLSRHVLKFSFNPPDLLLPLSSSSSLFLHENGASGPGSASPRSSSSSCSSSMQRQPPGSLGRERGREKEGKSEEEGPASARGASRGKRGWKLTDKDLRRLNGERRRNHVRSAVDSDGYGGMVRSARNAFLENFHDFIRKSRDTQLRVPLSFSPLSPVASLLPSSPPHSAVETLLPDRQREEETDSPILLFMCVPAGDVWVPACLSCTLQTCYMCLYGGGEASRHLEIHGQTHFAS